MFDFFEKLFSSEFMPHGECYLWQPDILWLHVISDAVTALSFFSIPFALFYLMKKRQDLVYNRLLFLFGGFILLCGATHIMGIWTVWFGTYRLAGIIKMLTAVFSIATALVIWPNINWLVRFPSPIELQKVNVLLQDEIEERKQIERKLKKHREDLEEMVQERTKTLEMTNQILRSEVAHREEAERKSKKSEEQYHELFDKYRDLYENAPDMYLSVNEETQRIVECNQTLAEELGMDKSEIIDTPIQELYCAESYKKVQEVTREFKENGRVRNVELCVKRKDGSHIDVMLNASAVRDEQGNMVKSRSSWRDVTAVKMASQAVQDSVARMSAILETAADAIVTTDCSGHIESFNPAAECIFGYSAEEVINRNIKMLMPAPYRENHDTYMKNYLETGEAKIIGHGREVEGRRRNGEVFPMDLSVSEYEVDGERRFTAIIRDITERKQLQRIKNDFVSIVSHELRTPITSINGSLGAISAGTVGELSDIALKMVTIAQRNCERLIRLINDLLDIQKMEAGKYEIHPERIDMVELLGNAIEINNGFAEEHNVSLELVTPDAPCWVQADADRILQVVTNLLSNASKFSPPGSTVTLRADVREAVVRVEVIDQGHGIPKNAQGQIFQKFMQADSSTKRTKGGTGLGLSISKRIIELHEGQIGFESEEEKGTTFYFELPCFTPALQDS